MVLRVFTAFRKIAQSAVLKNRTASRQNKMENYFEGGILTRKEIVNVAVWFLGYFAETVTKTNSFWSTPKSYILVMQSTVYTERI